MREGTGLQCISRRPQAKRRHRPHGCEWGVGVREGSRRLQAGTVSGQPFQQSRHDVQAHAGLHESSTHRLRYIYTLQTTCGVALSYLLIHHPCRWARQLLVVCTGVARRDMSCSLPITSCCRRPLQQCDGRGRSDGGGASGLGGAHALLAVCCSCLLQHQLQAARIGLPRRPRHLRLAWSFTESLPVGSPAKWPAKRIRRRDAR